MVLERLNENIQSQTTNRRPRALNINNINNINNIEINSDSDSEGNCIRVGFQYQAEIPNSFLNGPAPADYPEKSVQVWKPNDEIDDAELEDFIRLAKEKYKYNLEQSLGFLYWHKYDIKRTLSDMPNYTPYPDEWTMEDRALFEQAYQFHQKSFSKINQLLPDKKLSSIVKYYYTSKKCKPRSYVDRQVRKAISQSKDESNDLATDNLSIDYDINGNNYASNKDYPNSRKECSQCYNKNSAQYFSTKFGILCKACYGKQKSLNMDSVDQDYDEINRFQEDNEILKITDHIRRLISDPSGLKQIFEERLTQSTDKVLESYDNEICQITEKIRDCKQKIAETESKIHGLPLVTLNPYRLISRWTNEEILLMTQSISEYGKDFKRICEIIGSKTEQQIKNYYLQNEDKLKNLFEEFNEENDFFERELVMDEDK